MGHPAQCPRDTLPEGGEAQDECQIEFVEGVVDLHGDEPSVDGTGGRPPAATDRHSPSGMARGSGLGVRRGLQLMMVAVIDAGQDVRYSPGRMRLPGPAAVASNQRGSRAA